jgi:hypothetical protein
MSLRLFGMLGSLAALTALLPACVPQYDGPGFNAPVYARRPPPPGRPNYAQTIAYIDDGLRYVDPRAGFFVSPDGRMCFHGALNVTETVLDYISNPDWCLPPRSVGRVDSIATVTNSQVRVTCRHDDPQCVREIGNLNRETDSLLMPTVPARPEKAAVEYLVYLMGGAVGDGQPF